MFFFWMNEETKTDGPLLIEIFLWALVQSTWIFFMMVSRSLKSRV